MAALSVKSFLLWFSNTLIPFVLYMNLQVTTKDEIRAKVDLITSNAKILYAVLLSGWVIFNLLILWIKYQKILIEKELKELELKKKKNETTEN